MHTKLVLSAVLGLATLLPTQDRNTSEAPPGEAPWIRDFPSAQAEAARRGVPIFVYSTKTH